MVNGQLSLTGLKDNLRAFCEWRPTGIEETCGSAVIELKFSKPTSFSYLNKKASFMEAFCIKKNTQFSMLKEKEPEVDDT
jgi:hypothetical protein